MYKEILLIFVLLLSVTLFGQKKAKQVKVVHVAHPAVVTSLTRISPERNLRLTHREEAKKSLVVLKNEHQLLPLGRLDTLKVMVVSIGMGENNPLPKFIGRYIKADYLTIDPKAKADSISKKWTDPANYNLAIFVIGEQNRNTTVQTGKENQEDSISSELEERSRIDEERNLPEKIMAGTKAVFMLYGSPRFLAHWENAGRASALLATEKADYDRMDLSAQLLFGAINPTGKLPFDLNKYKKGDGIVFLSGKQPAELRPAGRTGH